MCCQGSANALWISVSLLLRAIYSSITLSYRFKNIVAIMKGLTRGRIFQNHATCLPPTEGHWTHTNTCFIPSHRGRRKSDLCYRRSTPVRAICPILKCIFHTGRKSSCEDASTKHWRVNPAQVIIIPAPEPFTDPTNLRPILLISTLLSGETEAAT